MEIKFCRNCEREQDIEEDVCEYCSGKLEFFHDEEEEF